MATPSTAVRFTSAAPALSPWSRSFPDYVPKARMWGNDVSLYSSALGAYLANQSFRLEVQEEKFAWLEPYLTDEEAKAAAGHGALRGPEIREGEQPLQTAPLGPLPEQLREIPPGHYRQTPGTQTRDPPGGLHLPGHLRPTGRDAAGCGGRGLSPHLCRGL